MFLVCFAASIAAMAMALCTYQLPVLLEHLGLGAVLTKPVVAGGPTGTTVGALCVVMLLTGINAVGARAAAPIGTGDGIPNAVG